MLPAHSTIRPVLRPMPRFGQNISIIKIDTDKPIHLPAEHALCQAIAELKNNQVIVLGRESTNCKNSLERIKALADNPNLVMTHVGHLSQNDVNRLNVSRAHVALFKQQDTLFIIDLDSLAGTLIKFPKANAPIKLPGSVRQELPPNAQLTILQFTLTIPPFKNI